MTVKAEDGKSIARDGKTVSFSATTAVLVYILDENDNGPVFKSSYTFHVRENATTTHEVGRVVAEDKDAGPNGRVTYRILSGNSGDRSD